MSTLPALGLRDHLTHRGNLKHTRYGWLRLTPAYSVHLVADILNSLKDAKPMVLDPFCGTGTTALVCAEHGVQADTTDINPFLVWLATVKTRKYQTEELSNFRSAVERVVEAMSQTNREVEWVPPLHQIEKWWDQRTLQALSRTLASIKVLSNTFSAPVIDLLKVAFCRTVIERANVSFGHQSMSFKEQPNNMLFPFDETDVINAWGQSCKDVFIAAKSEILAEPQALLCDARQLSQTLPEQHYSCVITSPPYPNRMSYIRELRPYMYWLGYLNSGQEAGELDWQAIGGTWGIATSRVGKWEPALERPIPWPAFDDLLAGIAERNLLLSRYVHKYFYDMTEHLKEMFVVVKPGGAVHYIVGNSKFYDVLLPVEEIFAAMFFTTGFEKVSIKAIRKRTSKKELYEYVVSAQKP